MIATSTINRIIPFLSKLIPGHYAVKGISKINPRLASFFKSAAIAGYGTDAALDFLRGQFGSAGAESNKANLEQRSQRGEARPDEMVALEQMRGRDKGKSALAGAIGLGTGLVSSAIHRQEKEEQPNQEAPRSVIDIISDSPLASTIDKALSGGESHRTIAEYLNRSHPDFADQLEEAAGMPLEEAIKLYASKRKGKRGMREQLREDFENSNQADSAFEQAISRLEGLLG